MCGMQVAEFLLFSFGLCLPAPRIPQNVELRVVELIESSLYSFAFMHPATRKLRNVGCGTINKLANFVLILHPAKLILMYFVFAVNCKMPQPATQETRDAGFRMRNEKIFAISRYETASRQD